MNHHNHIHEIAPTYAGYKRKPQDWQLKGRNTTKLPRAFRETRYTYESG